MVPLIIALVVALGAGGAVAVSDNAVPGDALFVVDRAVENVRLAFSSSEGKVKIKKKIAEERIGEVEQILEKEKKEKEDKIDDQDSDDTEDTEDIDEVENEDKNEDAEKGIEFAIELLSEIDGEDGEFDALVERLNNLLIEFPEDSKIDSKISDEGSSFIKLRSEEGSNRFDLEIKETGGGKAMIKSRDEEGKLEVEIENGKMEVQFEKRYNEDEVEEEDEDEDEDEDDKE